MTTYNFSVLDDKEFEELCADILSIYFNTHIEHFKPGRDGGVDCRYFSTAGEVVIQCKHWHNSTFSLLKSCIEQKEYPKIKKLSPSRYILMTSQDLSRKEKSELSRVLSPFIVVESDVWGVRDIVDLLNETKYNRVVKKNYKLWITSSAILQIFLNNDVCGRSEAELKTFIESARQYVETPDKKNAFKKLEEKHSLIITGAPGIGKTTLAEQLCIYYATQGFEIVTISKEISEAEKVYLTGRKQLFYFDDFLGSNYLCALNNREDSSVVRFIKRIQKDANKRFILTSRTNILNQGKRLSQCFVDAKIEQNEFELEIANLDLLSKAKILYTRIWHSRLSKEFVDAFYRNFRYMEIVKHRNYNPRVIAFITDVDRLNATSSADYWDEIKNKLDDPQDIWQGVFDTQLDDIQRYFVLLVFWNGGTCNEILLKGAFEASVDHLKKHLPPGLSTKFENNIRSVVGAVLNRTIDSHGVIDYTLFDPSIGDYILKNYVDNIESVLTPLSALKTYKSLALFLSLYKKSSIPNDVWGRTFRWYIGQLATNTLDTTMSLMLISFIGNNNIAYGYGTAEQYLTKIQYELLSVDILDDFISSLKWLYYQNTNFDWMNLCSNDSFVYDLCVTASDIDDLSTLHDFFILISENESFEMPAVFFDQVEEYFCDNIYQIAIENINASDIAEDDDYEAEQYIQQELEKNITCDLADRNIDINRISLPKCLSNLDMRDFISELHSDEEVADMPSREATSYTSIDDQIHQLFVRNN